MRSSLSARPIDQRWTGQVWLFTGQRLAEAFHFPPAKASQLALAHHTVMPWKVHHLSSPTGGFSPQMGFQNGNLVGQLANVQTNPLWFRGKSGQCLIASESICIVSTSLLACLFLHYRVIKVHDANQCIQNTSKYFTHLQTHYSCLLHWSLDWPVIIDFTLKDLSAVLAHTPHLHSSTQSTKSSKSNSSSCFLLKNSPFWLAPMWNFPTFFTWFYYN